MSCRQQGLIGIALALALCSCADDAKPASTKSGHHATKDASASRDDAAAADASDAAKPHDAGKPAPAGPADFQELLDLGIAEFIGAAKPTGSETISGNSSVHDGSVVYDFDPQDGPVCLRGAHYNVSLLDKGSDNLMIYLQGGGACVSILCQATTEATPRGVPKLGVLDITDQDNPVAGWNVLYVPYCDGSVFGGDNDFTDPNDAMGIRLHHGQRNFSAALDLALEHFPHPKKILLAGSSAGGWGTVFHRALVRTQYPDAELTVMDDAGIGFAVNQPYVTDQWGNAAHYQPPSCDECMNHSHMSPFVKYVLAHDPAMVVGDFSAWEDSVIMRFTFQTDPAAFRDLLKQETDIPASAFPDRYKRFFIDGSMHTTLLTNFHTTQINGVTIAEWLGFMIDRDPQWVELMQ